MKEKWFVNLERRNVIKYAHNSKSVDVSSASTGIVENEFLDVLSKGEKEIRENFKVLLLRLFPNMDYVEQQMLFFQDQYSASLSHIWRNFDNLKLDTPISMLKSVQLP